MRTVTEKYRAVNEGKLDQNEFVRQMRLSYPNLISQYNGFKDTVQILSNRGLLFEEKTMKHDVSDESIRRALDIEIANLGHDPVTIKDGEVIEKAKAKAIANLSKDPLHYYNLLANESSKVDKHDKMKETKKGKLEKDTFNDMKKATLKERKENLVEGTRALVGFLSGDRLTTTYNHYDGYPSNLGKGLEAHYNNDEAAKDVAMKGYITYMDPETGDIEATHNDAPGKVILPDDPEQRAREIAEEIDKFGADYGYVWDDESNQWITIKNTGIRSMIDQITEKIAMVNIHSGEKMNQEGDLDETEEEYLAKRDAAIKKAMGKDVDEVLSHEQKKVVLENAVSAIKKVYPELTRDIFKAYIDTHYTDLLNDPSINVADDFMEWAYINGYMDTRPEDLEENKGKGLDREIILYIADTYIQNAKDGDRDYAEFRDLNIRDAALDVVGILRDPKHPLHGETKKEYGIVERDKARGLFEKKGKDHDGDGDIDGDDYMAAKDKAIKKAMGKKVDEDAGEDEHMVHELIGDLFAPGNARYHLDMPVKEIAKALQDYQDGLTPQGVKAAMDLYDKLAADGTLDQEIEDGYGFIEPNHVPKLKKAFELIGLYGKGKKAVNELRGSGDDIIEIIKAMAMEFDGDEEEAAMEVMEFIGEHYKIDFEFGRVGGGNYGRNQGAPYEGKINEAVKNIVAKVLEEKVLTEAATNDLAKIADDYGDFEGLKPAIIALQNVVTEIESFYDKTRAKIQKVYNDLGEVRNEEGLKVGAFITPSIENAFKRDLKPIIKNQFHGGLEMPQVKRISQADVDRGYVQQEAPKQTVYSPVNEKKK